MKYSILGGVVGVAFSALIVGTPAFAQDRCGDVLRGNTVRQEKYHSSEYYQQATFRKFASSTYEESKDDIALHGSGSYAQTIMGTADYSREQFESRRSQIAELFSSTTIQFREIDYAIASADPDVINAWSMCMNRSPRVAIDFDRPTGRDVVITFRWISAETGTNEVMLTRSIDVDGAEVLEGAECLLQGSVLRSGAPCPVKLRLRGPETALAVTVATPRGAAYAFIPPKMRIAIDPRPFVANTGECAGDPPGIGDPSEPWRVVWGPACRNRGIGFARPGNQTPYSGIIELPDELRILGYRFDIRTPVLNLETKYGSGRYNRCIENQVENAITGERFRYSYLATAAGGVTQICTINPQIDLIRYVLVPS